MSSKISVIMPTFNSASTLSNALRSIRDQNYDQDLIDIIIVDGGSTDDTIRVAKEYNATILDNPLKLPEAAKTIGIMHANGEYICFLDSDESIENRDFFRRRVQIFYDNLEVNTIIATGIKSPDNCKGIVRYANAIGDPYSNYVYYRYDGTDYLGDTKKHIEYDDKSDYVLFRYREGDLVHPWDAKGSFYRMSEIKTLLNESQNLNDKVAILTELLVQRAKSIVITKDDYIIHDNGITEKVYREKIKWRIINNLFGSKGGVGYSNRELVNSALGTRKYRFVLYCISVVGPLFDSIRLTFKYQYAYFFKHIYWTEYTFGCIVFYYILKMLGKKDISRITYGK